MAVNTYPFKKYNYRVEIDSIDVAAFSEVSGFDASVDVIEYREGTDPINSPRKMPGLTKYLSLIHISLWMNCAKSTAPCF